jgi:hypothetical protein
LRMARSVRCRTDKDPSVAHLCAQERVQDRDRALIVACGNLAVPTG